MRTLIGLMLVFVFGTGIASAARLDPGQSQLEGGPAIVQITSGNGESTKRGNDDVRIETRGTATATTSADRNELRKKGQGLLKGSVPGVVTSVSSNSFVMTVPAGKDHATTSVTVNVSSATTFSQGSSTASLTNLSSGTRVLVFGKVSTSTQTVAAERVLIKVSEEGTQPVKKNLFERVKNFFKGRHASTTNEIIESRGGAAASMGASVGGFLHKLFGWL